MPQRRSKKHKGSRAAGDYSIRDDTVYSGPEAHLVDSVKLEAGGTSYQETVSGENRLQWDRRRRHRAKVAERLGGASKFQDETEVNGGIDEGSATDVDHGGADNLEAGAHSGVPASVSVAQLQEEFLGNGLLHPATITSGPRKKLIVFVSSTFTDTGSERDILAEHILPKLHQSFQATGIDIILVDLRYGVKDDNTKEHKTWQVCEQELSRCYNESGGLYFLSLQSNKYGYQPLSAELDKSVFEACVSKASAEHAGIAKSLYELDSNHVPPRYYLLPLKDLGSANPFWDQQKKLVHNVFRNQPVVGLSSNLGGNVHEGHQHEPQLIRTDSSSSVATKGQGQGQGQEDVLVGRSVSEWEARTALGTAGPAASSRPSRCYWVHRTWLGGVKKEHEQYWLYDDTLDAGDDRNKVGTKLRQLKSFMTERLRKEEARSKKEHIVLYREIDIASYLEGQNGRYLAYAREWTKDVAAMLTREAVDVANHAAAWAADGAGLGLEGSHLDEMLHHVGWAKRKIASFHGRSGLLHACIDRLSRPNRAVNISRPKPFDGVSLAIVGASGSGKTSLMAKLAQSLKRVDMDNGVRRLYVVRFCGTSRGSFDALSLVRGICLQIHAGMASVSPTSTGFSPDGGSTTTSTTTGTGTGTPSADFARLPWNPEGVPDDYEQCCLHSHSLLRTLPVALFIDSLDQLENSYQERSEVSFLKGVLVSASASASASTNGLTAQSNKQVYSLSLHPLSRIVVSTLADDAK